MFHSFNLYRFIGKVKHVYMFTRHLFCELSSHDFCLACNYEKLYVNCSLWIANIFPNLCLLIFGRILSPVKVLNFFQKSILLVIFLMLSAFDTMLSNTFPT